MKLIRMLCASPMLYAALVSLAPRPAHAAGINLAWNDCPLGSSSADTRAFACNTNAGSQVLVISFDPPPEIPRMVGINAIVDMYSEVCTLPDWWRFKYAGTCRQNSMSVSALVVPGQTGCADPWQGTGVGDLVAYLTHTVVPSMPEHRARILTGVTVADPLGALVVPGTEYYACSIVIANDRTVGPGACSGCSNQACFIVNSVLLVAPEGADPANVQVTNPLNSTAVSWQSSNFSCYVSEGGPQCTVPVQNHTWGRIKTLYR